MERQELSIEEIREKIEDLERRIKKLESRQSTLTEENMGYSGSGAKKEQTLREFLNVLEPKNNVERVLCIAYYNEVLKKVPPFTVKEMTDAFREAKEKPPENVNLPIFYNVQKGYLMESKNNESKLKTWELTNTGIKVIEDKMKGSASP